MGQFSPKILIKWILFMWQPLFGTNPFPLNLAFINCQLLLIQARVVREGKGVTSLVYAIEQHEHQLILLGKKAKLNLMKHHHLPQSRDFRIRGDVLKLAVAEQEANKVVM